MKFCVPQWHSSATDAMFAAKVVAKFWGMDVRDAVLPFKGRVRDVGFVVKVVVKFWESVETVRKLAVMVCTD